MARVFLAGACISAIAASTLAFAAPAGAAPATMTVTNVTYDPPSGPNPGCTAPLPPKGGTGSASYQAPDGTFSQSWEWSVPATITPGAPARIKATVTSNTNGGATASIRITAPADFGLKPPDPSQVDAVVPIGAPDTKTKEQAYTINPTRDFVAGEKLILRIGHTCVNYLYEYTATAPASACHALTGASVAGRVPACDILDLLTPEPGGTATVTSPAPLGAKDSKTAATVSSSTGDLKGTTIIGEGERTPAQVIGEAVAACWLIGPEAVTVPPDSLLRNALTQRNLRKEWKAAQDDPEKAFHFCLAFVRVIVKKPTPTRRLGAAGAGCNERRIAIRGRIRKGKVVSLVPVTTNPSTAVRYTCRAAAGGRIKLTVDGRRSGGLKKQLGKRLDLGVVRSPNAPAGRSRLTFGFGPP